jgi:hypothetical protein
MRINTVSFPEEYIIYLIAFSTGSGNLKIWDKQFLGGNRQIDVFTPFNQRKEVIP